MQNMCSKLIPLGLLQGSGEGWRTSDSCRCKLIRNKLSRIGLFSQPDPLRYSSVGPFFRAAQEFLGACMHACTHVFIYESEDVFSYLYVTE